MLDMHSKKKKLSARTNMARYALLSLKRWANLIILQNLHVACTCMVQYKYFDSICVFTLKAFYILPLVQRAY